MLVYQVTEYLMARVHYIVEETKTCVKKSRGHKKKL